MKKFTIRSLFALAAAGGLALFAAAQDADGWVSLFDGKSIEGWTVKSGFAKYEVVDGAIHGVTAEGSPNSFLCSAKEYGDFELEFDVKVHDSLNSGVQIRSQLKDIDKPNSYGGRVFGPQVEIEASPGQAGYIYGEATGLGWLSKEPQDKTHAHNHIKNGEWNHFRVVAKGPRIQTWINGEAVADLTHEEIHGTHPKGFIGLQVHGIGKNPGPYDVSWKNLRIKELK
ncbi:MAG: DUF1080 domain-containing protein [Verrucomicrobiae bacterium]|nr:DUF1080 domain-containing protein [Verrucomicrobiae bacterium]MCP5549686.1 DUF1080 domain-containing protein [Akkermansiaceae bacterium]